MSSASSARIAFGALALVLFTATPALARQKPTLEPADYGRWEDPRSATLSPDGKWLAVPIRKVDGDEELRVRLVGSDSLIAVPNGTQVAFSDDGRWLGYTIGHSEKERKALEKQKKPVHSRFALVDLRNGKKVEVENVASFQFSGDGHFLAMRGYTVKDQKNDGVDLIVRNLETGRDTNFGNVSDYAWQDAGHLIAMTIDAALKAGNGVQLYDPASGRIVALDSDTTRYTGLAWRDSADDLAVLRARTSKLYEDTANVVLAWRDLAGEAPVAKVLDPAAMEGFPADYRVVDYRALSWSDDGETIYFGIRERRRKEPGAKDSTAVKDSVVAGDSTAAKDSTAAGKDGTAKDDEEKPGVEVWHAADVDIIPEQKVRADIDRKRNYLSAWHLDDGSFVEVGNELTEDATVVDARDLAVGQDQTPYRQERMFGPVYDDLYIIDTRTGERTKFRDRIQYDYDTSPDGRYVLYLVDDNYWVYDVRKKTNTNLTADIATSFIDVEDDHTVDQKPPFGVGGWTRDGASVLLYDKYDIWQVPADGGEATRLTDGAGEKVRHRIVRLDYDQDFVDLSRPVYVALYGETTKKFGYGRIGGGKPAERLVWQDANITRLSKAEHAGVFAYMVEDFDDSPDYFVGDAGLAGATQVTHTNPFQGEYAWGRSELLDFRNRQGVDLQAALFYPANYQAGKKYPMIVYIYEITSNTLHNFDVPSERTAYNVTDWTQEGYFVLRPDIVYRDRNPGLSAVDALVPAVQRAVATGMIDSTKVGLVGHSWGGYQTAFVPTQTDIFAAAVAGAPLTEMASMYLSVYWNSGGTDARIFEISQGRMEVPPWQDPESYMKNSAVWNIESLHTPMLITFGDKDGAVDWDQGIEMYNAARRAGKQLVMLVYAGENHGLAKKPNQIDYHRRIMEWFAHYLKGEPAPDWIREGVPFLVQDREKKTVAQPISER